MNNPSLPFEPLGLLRPAVDVHTLGTSALASILATCGITTVVQGEAEAQALLHPQGSSQAKLLLDWLSSTGVRSLGFSFRLDPGEALRHFGAFAVFLERHHLLQRQGGPIRRVWFAGLPPACQAVREAFPWIDGTFDGDQDSTEVLAALGIPPERIPPSLAASSRYEAARLALGHRLVASGAPDGVRPPDRSQGPRFGTWQEGLLDRVDHGHVRGLPPLMRAHAGPWLPDRTEAVRQFLSWARRLGSSGYLDVLSVGSSQLSQERFEENWTDLDDGGGVPLQNRAEFHQVWEAARPLLVRTYAGSRKLPDLAAAWEESINPAWHTFSFWWFNRLDGRGPLDLLPSLEEHFATLAIVARAGRPFEANVPHHFAFRGADDTTYVLAGYLAAKAAKLAGIRTYVLQVMLNTPRHEDALADLAKARALITMVRSLEDSSFRVLVQPRGGLDYFSPRLDKAKAQLAAVTMLMDDLEPENHRSPDIIHVVSYSEASHLADPAIIDESIRITRAALDLYREEKRAGHMAVPRGEAIDAQTRHLVDEARTFEAAIMAWIPRPFSPKGFHDIFAAGFLPVPWLWACRDDFPHAVSWTTGLVDGRISCVYPDGRPTAAMDRLPVLKAALDTMGRKI